MAGTEGSGGSAHKQNGFGASVITRNSRLERNVAWLRFAGRRWAADEVNQNRRRGQGHRQVARRRLRCRPQQDDQLAQSKPGHMGGPLAVLDQGLGPC